MKWFLAGLFWPVGLPILLLMAAATYLENCENERRLREAQNRG